MGKDLDIDKDKFDKLVKEMDEEWELIKKHPIMKALLEISSDPDFMAGE